MQISRSLTALAVLLGAVFVWLVLASPPSGVSYAQALEMAPASMEADGTLPGRPPDGLDWRPLDQRELAGWRNPYWLRWRLPAPVARDAADRAMRLSLRAASQLFWNGQPLPGNGEVGRTAEEEQPGRIDIVRVLPPSSPTGTDELVVLASSHHQWFRPRSADAFIAVGPVESIYGHGLGAWLIAALATGALGAACLYFLAA